MTDLPTFVNEPIGELRRASVRDELSAGMAYLVRRLLENTSNESFLHEQAAGRSLDDLLAAP